MNFKILSKKSERILNECIRFNRKIEKIKLYKIIPISQYEKFIVDKYNIKTDEKLEDANLTIDELYNKKLHIRLYQYTLRCCPLCSFAYLCRVLFHTKNLYIGHYLPIFPNIHDHHRT